MTTHILPLLQERCRQATLAAFPQLSDQPAFAVEVTRSTQERFGHYQYNSPMKLSKLLSLAPRQIADKIVEKLDRNFEGKALISAIEVAGPGFINLTVASEFINDYLNAVIADPRIGIEPANPPKRIVIDFSSPNTAKEMHVGHLRSTIIGDCLARYFEFMGHDVLRLNHVGDWGTSFGMLIAYLKKYEPAVVDGSQQTDLSHLVTWYKASKQLFDSDAAFKKQSQNEVVALQGGDPASLKAWSIICDISRKAYQQIYDLLDVKLIERGESFYNPMLADVVADLESQGLVTISNGAKCIFVEGFKNREGEPLPLMVQKSDGGYNYDTTDIAAIRQRIAVEHGQRLIYVTDAGQALHFQLVFKVAEMAGYLHPEEVKVDHVPFGLVLGADGKKFRTRSGETEKLIDLLTTAIDEADKLLAERSPDLSAEERHKTALALGIGAIKYADLSSQRTSDYTFSYERMLRFEGNTAAYLMYSYVRVGGIKRKVGEDIEKLIGNAKLDVQHPAEIALAIHLMQFSEVLRLLSEDLYPHRLTEYLYGLAEKFNSFFRDCRVEGTAEQSSRLLLCELVARTMKQGLDILGVPTIAKM